MSTSRALPSRMPADALERPGSSIRDAFQPAFAAIAALARHSTADARERHLSRAVDHDDLERRVRAWDAHEARLSGLPLVL